MSITCSVYGLGIQVNVPIAGLIGLPTPSKIDVYISVGTTTPEWAITTDAAFQVCHVSAELDERGCPALTVNRSLASGDFRFVYSDGTTVVIDAQGSRVWATSAETASVEDTAAYLLGPILRFVLRLRGITCLHASAVAIDGQAVALVGPAGAGKSSAAAAFAQLGFPVLADDVVALSDQGHRFSVQPAYPRVRLWPASVTALFGSAEALPRITPNWDKCFLDLNAPGFQFQHEPLPLSAIYILGERRGDLGVPMVEILSSREGMMALVSDTHASLVLDRAKRAQEFEMLGRLVKNVPLRRVTACADFARIAELCAAIIGDLKQKSVRVA